MECLIDETPCDRWQHLSGAALAPMQQCWTYGQAAGAMGRPVMRLEVRDGGETIALAQVVHRRIGLPVSLITRGPVWIGHPDTEQRASALALMRRSLRGLFLVTAPDESGRGALRHAGMVRVMPPSTMAMLKLDQEFRARMHAKWRNRLVAVERGNLRLRRSATVTDLRWLFEADAVQQKARGYRALPAAFTEAWRRHDPDGVECVIAMQAGERLAAMLFLRHGTTATYHVGWTGDQGRAANAHNLILSHACVHLLAKGVRQLDLGQIDLDTAPGLARFKLGTGASAVRTGGTWLRCW